VWGNGLERREGPFKSYNAHMAKKKPTAKNAGIAKQRRNQLLRGQGNYTHGNDFLTGWVRSAGLLLAAAASERRPPGCKNFLSFYGPSAIVAATTAFEVFLNETLHEGLFINRTNELEELATRDSFIQKFRRLPALLTGGDPISSDDVELLHHVRNEIVHYYPRYIGTDSEVPEWLESLVQKDVLFTLKPKVTRDIGWTQKLRSYGLATWSGRTVVTAALQFADVIVTRVKDRSLGMLAFNVQNNAASLSTLMHSIP